MEQWPAVKKSLPIILVLMAGIGISFVAYFFTDKWAEEKWIRSFERESIVHAKNLEQQLGLTLGAILSVKALYQASEQVERAEFKAFTNLELVDRIGIQAMEWVPRVALEDRAEFEAAARRDGLTGFKFTERKSQGQMIPVEERTEYFPVFFVEPLAGNKSALGFDMGSNPIRLEAMHKARDSGKAVATSRITLVQESGNQYGFLLFEPIYQNGSAIDTVEQRRTALQGFGLGVLRIGDIVEAGSERKDTELAVHRDLFLFDTLSPVGSQQLYPREGTIESRADIMSSVCVDISLQVGGRDWLIVYCPTAGKANVWRWQSGVVLFAGLMGTGMQVAYLISILRKKLEVEGLIEGLRSSDDRYRALFDNAHDMIQSIDL
ncbi:MAG TPA: hypothetical protein EYQ01_10045, partial [Nitrospira sp.]|nr:hypothetical protein [Candidatus Manganitrophaceae bacterium]